MNTKAFRILLLCAAVCFFTSPIQAQVIDKFVLNYEPDAYQLSDVQLQMLDSRLSKLSNISAAYIIKVQGHTDTDGSHYYNTLLSERRAKKVIDYLKAKGFNTKTMSMSASAFDEPVATNDNRAGKSQNRRVEVTVELIEFSPAKVLNIELEPEVFTIEGNSSALFVTEKGIKVHVPYNAFEDKDGNWVNEWDDIIIEFQEYATPIDFLLAGVTMNYDVTAGDHGNQPGHFSSQGMFKIEATQNGEELFLREEKEIRVDMPIQGVPDVGWYQVDTATGNWNQLDQVTNNRGSALSGNSFNFRGLPTSGGLRGNLCPKNYELKIRSSYKEAIEYGKWASRSDISFTSLFAKRDEQAALRAATPKEFERANEEYEEALRKYKSYKRKYKVVKATENGENFVFDVHVSNSRQSGTEFQAFRYKFWEYKAADSEAFLQRMKNELWDDIELLYNKDAKGFRMRFRQANWDTTVSVNPFNAAKDQQSDSFIKTWGRMYDDYKERREAYRGPYERLLQRKNNLLGNCLRFNGAAVQMDTITAFWIYSRQLMDDPQEREMCMEEWLEMFENNKEAMRLRYDTLHRLPLVADQERMAERRARMAELQAGARSAATKILETKFSLTSLGMYNADVVKKIDQPILAKASYRNTDGEEFKPIFTYLIDDNINGLIEYNGYMGFSPYHFVFSSTSKNIMFAFDAEGGFYVCEDDQFKAAGGKPGDTVKHTFVMRKLEVKDKKDLDQLLVSN